MTISIFDLFSIGVGPSSSHTVGPMRAANLFIDEVKELGKIDETKRILIDLYGSLALTGKGHGTDFAVITGLEANLPESVDPKLANNRFEHIKKEGGLHFAGKHEIAFDYEQDLIFHYEKVLPHHANGMCFTAFDVDNNLIITKTYYSIGGGFVVDDRSFDGTLNPANTCNPDTKQVPFPFRTAEQLLTHCEKNNKTIAEILLENEKVFRTQEEVKQGVLNIWHVMSDCIDNGISTEGILPGGLNIKRRAPGLFNKLTEKHKNDTDTKQIHKDMNLLSLYAIAVNEENAAGGKVVTAPTNGAAGTIPAVLKFYTTQEECTDDKIVEFLLTAAAIGILYKEGASISAAEVGCQGEVGVACSMAAGAYAAVLGGNIHQVENAAEIGMEHNLGMTCDPIGGLVQIPCIERNASGAVQAINAAQLALLGDGVHYVSLDKVIRTMRETGRDMMSKYKETSQGGLAVNLPEC